MKAEDAVELSVTVWERTWRNTLQPSFFAEIERSVRRTFDRTVVVINNVDDLAAVRKRCHLLMRAGVVDDFVVVAEALPGALRQVGLSPRKLEPLPHYTDHFLVKLCHAGPRWLVHWDTDVVLTIAGDWITPSINYLSTHAGSVVAMPGWMDETSMSSTTLRHDGPFNVCYGFSDHIFLVERSRLARPIYRHVSPASWSAYPTSHLTPIFEQRIDAWMRRHRHKLVVYRHVRYVHDEHMASQPASGIRQRIRRRFHRDIARLMQGLPFESPRLRR